MAGAHEASNDGGQSAGGASETPGETGAAGNGGAPQGGDDPECTGWNRCELRAKDSVMPMHSAGHAVALYHNQIYVFGGSNFEHDNITLPGEDPQPAPLVEGKLAFQVEPYAPTWTRLAPMPHGLFTLAAHTLDDAIYVFGGRGPDGLDPVVQSYDPSKKEWTERAAMPTPRDLFASAALAGKVYVVGGQVPDAKDPGKSLDTAQVEIYDPVAGWSAGTPLPEPLSDAAACASGSKLYVFGGSAGPKTYIYDATKKEWATGAPLPTARRGHICLELAGVPQFDNQAAYLFGGRNDQGLVMTIDRYEPRDNTWSDWGGGIPEGRYAFGGWTEIGQMSQRAYFFGGKTIAPSNAATDGLLDRIDDLSFR